MAAEPFISYAQNAEDVLLWRALRHVPVGSYVDVGAWHATVDSVTKAFYDRGWRGVNVEPVAEMAAELRECRPGDEVVEAAVTSSPDAELVLHRVRHAGDGAQTSGLSTLQDSLADKHARSGWDVEDLVVPTRTLTSVCLSPLLDGDIHFLKIDVEGAEADALRSLDLTVVRPWIMVVEATQPGSTEPSHEEWEPMLLANGYEFCIFDGLSRYYTAEEHPELKSSLSYPACVFDNFVPAREQDLHGQLAAAAAEHARLWDDVINWRALALDGWSVGFGKLAEREAQVQRLRGRLRARNQELRRLRQELARMTGSASWRLTEPLRAVRSRAGASMQTRRGAGSADDD